MLSAETLKNISADKDALGNAKERKMNFGNVDWAGYHAHAKNLSIAPNKLFDRLRYLMVFKNFADIGWLI